ncbi:hypothetical protein [Paractinoplanes toevensis]|uniref:Uncharacterized protein n=1 Tax=Paractinoplanes toevensis TaxID=571911 RepID=A0A919T6M9_9ACTN|nr:hypothetical protein [Actinoplanes toevensis]GIM90128.1 hypothetical protein Ato02nite_019210 [Actinoplanes toevensis]
MSHRMWFRLTDVLPLAEHAMACFEHRTTGVEVGLDVSHGPALIWTGSALMDLLSSNGVPTWHREDASMHIAEAYTWRNTTGAYGTAHTDGYHTAYLPLTNPDGSTGFVMNVLRGSRDSGYSWLAVDIDPTDARLIGPTRVHALPCRHGLVPTDTAWTPAEVTCRHVDDRPYPALIADGYTSDSGDLLARFDTTTIARMTADLEQIHTNPDRDSDPIPGEYPHLRLSGDVLTVLQEHDNPHLKGGTVRATDYLTPDQDGRYPLGAYLWPWRHADQPTTTADQPHPDTTGPAPAASAHRNDTPRTELTPDA